MKTITRLKREPVLYAAIVTRLSAMAKEPMTAADILLNFEPDPKESIMGDAGYDQERRESGVLILATLDELVNNYCAKVTVDDFGRPLYQVL